MPRRKRGKKGKSKRTGRKDAETISLKDGWEIINSRGVKPFLDRETSIDIQSGQLDQMNVGVFYNPLLKHACSLQKELNKKDKEIETLEKKIEDCMNNYKSIKKDDKIINLKNDAIELDRQMNNIISNNNNEDDNNTLSLIIEINLLNNKLNEYCNSMMNNLNNFSNNNENNAINNFEKKWFEWDINDCILWFKYNLTKKTNNCGLFTLLQDNTNDDNKIDNLTSDDDDDDDDQTKNDNNNNNNDKIKVENDFVKMGQRMKLFGFVTKTNFPLMAQEYKLFEQICGIKNKNQCKLLCNKTQKLLAKYPKPSKKKGKNQVTN